MTMRRVFDLLLLAIALVAGAFLRLRKLDAIGLWLDEILDYDIATKLAAHPTWHWSAVSKEHGPLFFAMEVAGRVAHSIELAARLPPAVIGIATLLLAWFAVRKQFGVGAIFALLLATSPLHVYYSREARPYALLMFFTVALIALLLRANAPRLTALALLGIALTSATGAPLLIGAAVAAALAYWFSRDRFFLRVAFIACVCVVLVPLLYIGNPDPTAVTAPAVSFDRLLQSFAMSALDSTAPRAMAYAVALAALIGAIVAVRADRVRGAIVVSLAVVPTVTAIVALLAMSHWYAARYVAAAVPAYLLLAAIGIVATAQFIVRRREVAALVVSALIAGAIAREAWPAAIAEPLRRLDWRVVANTIRQHSKRGDLVIAMNSWSYISLDFYLRGSGLRMINVVEYTEGARHLIAQNESAWIVSAGATRGMTREWTCRYPIVLASPLESFRLHYAPSYAHLMTHRATDADRRAFDARFHDNFSLGFGPESNLFLGDGFGDAEGTNGDYARWVVGTHASLIVPNLSRFTLRALPLLGRGEQRMTVAMNGAPIAEFALAPEWREYTIDVPPEHRRSGANELTLTFAWAKNPGGNDPRSLSAMVDELRGDDRSGRAGSPPSLTHINSAGFLIDRDVERHPPERFVARDREALTQLLARLGFDPVTTLPALDRGDVRLDDLTAVVADESECRSDAEFVALAYSLLTDQRVEGTRAQYYLNQLRRGVPRRELVRKIVASGTMRAKLHAVAD